MAVSSKISIKGQVKSISLPCRSHPTTIQIEELLNNIKTTAAAASKPSAETICRGLSQLAEVYKCLDVLLNSSTTKGLISRQQNKKWVEDLIDESVKFLDVCGSTRDMVSQIKQHIIDLHCALRRRRKGSELNLENSIAKYNSFRKKMKKDVKFLVTSLKQVGGSKVVDSDNHHLTAVIKAVIGVSEMTILVLESLLVFLSVPISKPNRWSAVVSKLKHKGRVACEDQQGIVDEFESIDSALQTLCKYKSTQIKKSGLERLENQIECMETRLECMFRCLIGTRSSFLNIISQ